MPQKNRASGGTTFSDIKRIECDTQDRLCHIYDSSENIFEVKVRSLHAEGDIKQSDYIVDDKIRLRPQIETTLECQYTGDTQTLRCTEPFYND